jgi:glycosyltransferase involved in cell wall biosynthesis
MNSVLLLGPSLSAVSGVSTHLNLLLDSSLSQKFRLTHFQIGSEGRQESTFGKLVRLIWSPFGLAIKIIAHRPDIVHLNTSINPKAFWRDAVYLVVAKMLGRKVVYQVHGGDLPGSFFGNSGVLNWFARWLLRLPDAIVLLATGELHAYRLFSDFKYLSVIPNAVNLSLYAPVERKLFDSDSIRLGYIGRLDANKGIAEAIEALSILRERGIDRLHFKIAGSGPGETALREQVLKLRLDDRVEFAGPLFGEAKARFWREVDIFVFPTYQEGLPYAALESLASGTPLVTTPVGGIPDAVDHGVEGVLIEPREPEAIADSLQALTSDRALLRRMSAACLQKAKEQYSIERLVRQFTELYKAML